jgi:hypothetical protein
MKGNREFSLVVYVRFHKHGGNINHCLLSGSSCAGEVSITGTYANIPLGLLQARSSPFHYQKESWVAYVSTGTPSLSAVPPYSLLQQSQGTCTLLLPEAEFPVQAQH